MGKNNRTILISAALIISSCGEVGVTLPALLDNPALFYLKDRCDPWLLWSLATKFAGHPDLRMTPGDVRHLLVAAEFKKVPAADSPLNCAQVYDGQRFVTGTVPVNQLATLLADTNARRTRLGAPLLGPATPESRRGGPSLRVMPELNVPVVAVIDHGFAFANHAFRDDDKKSRVQALWDQSPDRVQLNGKEPSLWKHVEGFGYGGVLTKEDIDGLIAQYSDEMQLYAEAQYEPAQRRISHGTHVLDLAAGHPDPMPSGGLHTASPGNLTRDDAAKAPILLVQLPAKPAEY